MYQTLSDLQRRCSDVINAVSQRSSERLLSHSVLSSLRYSYRYRVLDARCLLCTERHVCYKYLPVLSSLKQSQGYTLKVMHVCFV